jgi:hypothetical protein
VSGSGFAFWSDGQSSHFTNNCLYFMANNGISAVAVSFIKQAGTLNVKNSSGQEITGVWIVLHGAAWGNNLLTADIPNQATHAFSGLSAGYYDLQVELADGTMLTSLDFSITTGINETYTAS